MSQKKVSVEVLNIDLNRHWGWLLGLGILFIILGCVGLTTLVSLTLISVLFLGILLIIAGVSQIIDVFKSRRWRGAVWHGVIGLLYLLVGGVVIYDPFLASSFITALIAWLLIVIGIARLVMAFSLRHGDGWAWLILAGCTAIILGIFILLQWPSSGLWILGMFIAVELLMNGCAYVFMALAAKNNI